MISYVAALLAAVANASSNVLNRKATREEPARVEFRPKLIFDLLRRRVWLIAAVIMLASFVLGAVALGTGQLAAVQIIIILELPMTLLGAARFLGGRLGRREWAAIAGMTSGVIGLLVCLDPQAGPVPKISPVEWVIGSAATGGPVLALFLLARRTSRPGRRAALLGLATGLAYGLASAYTKGMTEQVSAGGIAAALASWDLYAAGAAGIIATWLLQNAYHAGRLAAAQPGITLCDPAAATAWGVVVFGEQVRGGAVFALTLLPLAVLAASVVMLGRSPVLRAAAGADESAGGQPSQRRRKRAGQPGQRARRHPGKPAKNSRSPAGEPRKARPAHPAKSTRK